MSSEMTRGYQQRVRAERAAETRRVIVEATVALHEELGPAQTTVAAIAERAGVSRPTVYKQFPDETALFAACSAQWNEEHPAPELPGTDLEDTLLRLYRYYAENVRMIEGVERDALLEPPVAQTIKPFWDALDQVACEHAGDVGGTPATRAALRLVLDFWTWRRLAREGLSEEQAAALAAGLVRCVGRR